MKSLVILFSLIVILPGCKESSFTPGLIPGPALNTAKYRLEDVTFLAGTYGRGLRLMGVSSQDVHTDGTSDTWQYRFVDAALPPTSFWFHADASGVEFDSTSATGVGVAAVTHAWSNSDWAMFIAESAGGLQFRTDHPRCSINASLGEPVVPAPTTFWWVTYRSQDAAGNLLFLAIDANTGEVSLHYPL